MLESECVPGDYFAPRVGDGTPPLSPALETSSPKQLVAPGEASGQRGESSHSPLFARSLALRCPTPRHYAMKVLSHLSFPAPRTLSLFILPTGYSSTSQIKISRHPSPLSISTLPITTCCAQNSRQSTVGPQRLQSPVTPAPSYFLSILGFPASSALPRFCAQDRPPTLIWVPATPQSLQSPPEFIHHNGGREWLSKT